MDPLSIAASALALYTASESTFKLVRSLYHYSRHVSHAGPSILLFTHDVEDFGLVVGSAYCSLNTHLNRSHSRSSLKLSPALSFIQDNQVLEKLVRQCELVIADLEKLKLCVKGLKGRQWLWVAVKWAFRKKDVEGLAPKMGSVKASLQVVLSIVTLEAVMQEPKTVASEREIKRLNRQIHAHVRTIDLLHEKLDAKFEAVFGELNEEVQEALVELGDMAMDDQENEIQIEGQEEQQEEQEQEEVQTSG